jgi:hypothetical protein
MLQGHALQTLQLIDVERVRSLIPPELEIISVFPGKTVGGVYLSYYGSGSVLEYSELIVVAGLVSYSGKLGGWVSHIYVDNPNSVAGGREIWGLPKQLAEFTWENGKAVKPDAGHSSASWHHNQVTVRQGAQLLCSLRYNWQSFGLPIPFSGNIFSTLDSSILLFQGQVESHIGLVNGKLTVPAESPFGSLELGKPWLTLYCDQMRLITREPEAVGHRKTEFSYSVN